MRARAEFSKDGREEAITNVLCIILCLNLTPELCCVNDKWIESSLFHLHLRKNGE